jgi:hypothetical protein
MRVSQLWFWVITAALLSACGAKTPVHPRSSCVNASAIPVTSPLIEVQPTGSPSPEAIIRKTSVACGTILIVKHGGTAGINYGTAAGCQLRQVPGSSQPAELTSRNPADAFFELGTGEILCTIKAASPPQIKMCGLGTLLLNGTPVPMQGSVTCNSNSAGQPVFRVSAFSGSFLVMVPGGAKQVVPKGQQLRYDFMTRRSLFSPAVFSPAEKAAFGQQADALGLRADDS